MAEYNFTFAIDCDEVLRKTLDRMIELYNENFNADKKREDVNDFMVEKSFPDIEPATGMTASKWFFQEHSTELFLDVEAFPYIKEDIETLRKYGKVIILTYQKSYLNKIQTLQWLDNNGIEADGVCFLKDKTLLTADYLVDDNDWNFGGSHVKHGILINAPYNISKDVEDVRRTSCSCVTMDRCENLHEFVEKFTGAIKALEEVQSKYPVRDRFYILKDAVPYVESGYRRETRYFCKAGEKVRVSHYFISGIKAYVRITCVHGWGDVCVDVNDLKKYI